MSEQEIARLKEQVSALEVTVKKLIDVVYELSNMEIELSGQIVVPDDTEREIQLLKFRSDKIV